VSCLHGCPGREQHVLTLLPGHTADADNKRGAYGKSQPDPAAAPVIVARAPEPGDVDAGADHAEPALQAHSTGLCSFAFAHTHKERGPRGGETLPGDRGADCRARCRQPGPAMRLKDGGQSAPHAKPTRQSRLRRMQVHDVGMDAVNMTAQAPRFAGYIRAGCPLGSPTDSTNPPIRQVVGEPSLGRAGDYDVPAPCMLVRAEGGHVGRDTGVGRLGHMKDGRHLVTRFAVSSSTGSRVFTRFASRLRARTAAA
jgi:hypothetical protein